MSLIDTTDSTVMVGAYGWAFVRPIRKLYYNMMITFVSVVAALLIGGVEALGLIATSSLCKTILELYRRDEQQSRAARLRHRCFFIASWIVSFLVYKVKGYDRIEASA